MLKQWLQWDIFIIKSISKVKRVVLATIINLELYNQFMVPLIWYATVLQKLSI